jgi:hypothetical protein
MADELPKKMLTDEELDELSKEELDSLQQSLVHFLWNVRKYLDRVENVMFLKEDTDV